MTLMEIRKRPHWSFSSLNSLLNNCSLQWKFQKIDKLKPTHTSVNLVAGSVYHRTLDQVFMAGDAMHGGRSQGAVHAGLETDIRIASSPIIHFGRWLSRHHIAHVAVLFLNNLCPNVRANKSGQINVAIEIKTAFDPLLVLIHPRYVD